MVLKSLGRLEGHALSVLFMAFILVMFWHAIWGLADNLENYLERTYGLKKVFFDSLTILIVVLIIGMYPEILEKL